MQAYRLTVDKFLDHAAKWFGNGEIVEADAGRVVARTTYAELRERSNRLSGALAVMGLMPGDRVATLAWNTRNHLEDAPTRTILCAGAGNFATANVTLTHGYHAGAGEDAGEQVIAHWREVSDRTGEIVPAYGFTQAEREVASAGLTAPVLEAQR